MCQKITCQCSSDEGFNFILWILKKKCFEIVVITYNGKKGTELRIFEYFGINVIQIFDQI